MVCAECIINTSRDGYLKIWDILIFSQDVQETYSMEIGGISSRLTDLLKAPTMHSDWCSRGSFHLTLKCYDRITSFNISWFLSTFAVLSQQG